MSLSMTYFFIIAILYRERHSTSSGPAQPNTLTIYYHDKLRIPDGKPVCVEVFGKPTTSKLRARLLPCTVPEASRPPPPSSPRPSLRASNATSPVGQTMMPRLRYACFFQHAVRIRTHIYGTTTVCTATHNRLRLAHSTCSVQMV